MNIEKSVTSQNGEDGIIEYMLEHIINPNKQFLEIGWGDGIHNMAHNLMIKGWGGLGVDLMPCAAEIPASVKFVQTAVTPEGCAELLKETPKDVDFFSLDIDSYDYEISKQMLILGYRPKVICLEINKRFGPTVHASFPYIKNSPKKTYHKIKWCGVSLAKYIKLWQKYDYEFFTCDSSCTNAFFYHKQTVRTLDYNNTIRVDNFPITSDTEAAGHINEHSYWRENKHVIYQEDQL